MKFKRKLSKKGLERICSTSIIKTYGFDWNPIGFPFTLRDFLSRREKHVGRFLSHQLGKVIVENAVKEEDDLTTPETYQKLLISKKDE